MSEATLLIAVVCEARADREIACTLADRILLECVSWLDEEHLPYVRSWRGLAAGSPFWAWKDIRALSQERHIRAHGHFNSVPGEADAAAARRAIRVLMTAEPSPQAVLLIRDSDGDERRCLGLNQARDEHRGTFALIIGVAHTKRECWVLNGFVPIDETETAQLDQCRRDLGFCPVASAEKLDATAAGAKRSAKRVHRLLLGSDSRREERCWNETPIERLTQTGRRTGLTSYLDEIRSRLVPLICGQSPGR